MKEVHRYGPAKDAPPELYQVEAAIESVGARLPWQYQCPRHWKSHRQQDAVTE